MTESSGGAGPTTGVSLCHQIGACWLDCFSSRRQCWIGGGIRSGAVTVPGFWHDRYATNFGQFVASPAYQELKSEYDSTWRHIIRSEKPYASVHGNRALRIYTDPERTLAEFAAIGASEAKGWQKLKRLYQRTAQNFLALYSFEMPSAAMWFQIGRMVAAGIGDALRMARLSGNRAATSPRAFSSRMRRGVFSSWGAHLDFGPDVAGGAVFAFVSSVSNPLQGMPIVKGGAGRITEALRILIERAGDES